MSLIKYILRIADSSLIEGQRLSEWCSKGPTLEEDIAMSNIALDLFGQANGFLEYASKIDKKKSPDDFAFKRNEEDFYNLKISEQPNGHFGTTMIKLFFSSTYRYLLYEELSNSNDETISALSLKSIKEVKYHLKHSKSWVIRLGDGTKESNNKVQQSLNTLWEFTGEYFEEDSIDLEMKKNGIGLTKSLENKWKDIVIDTLNKAKLEVPKSKYMQTGSKQGLHTEYLGKILTEMQSIPRKYPDAKW